MQYTSLTADRALNSLTYQWLFYVTILKLKPSKYNPVFVSPCIMLRIQELISRLDSRTLRAVTVLGFLDFSNNTKNA